MKARYHLRFQVAPDPASDLTADVEALAKACHDAGVEEVVLFLGAEERFDGHLCGAAEDRWFETVSTSRDILASAGLTVSLNPWVTAGHADRGRVDRLGFTPMVSPTGQVAAAQASFACPRWRSWIVGHYGRFATLGLRVLWLEDDFRYHNHAPLDWGGGFEQPMLDRLAALVGEPVSREEVVAAIGSPGEPHPWRALLQQVWRTAQIEVAELLSDEVDHRSGGRSQLGLMSSGPEIHSVEGRDWTALFEALRVQGAASHRPHFATYSDEPARGLSERIWLLETQRRLRPGWVASEPEIENFPHTDWSKSDRQSWSEMCVAQFSGTDALFLDLYPFTTRRPQDHPKVGELLRHSRPALDWISAHYDRDYQSLGVGIPAKPDVAAHTRLQRGGLVELGASARDAPNFLMRYGIPVTAQPAPVQALFGSAAWAFAEDEIRTMLAGGLLLDGTAAVILKQRGFGDLLGLAAAELVDRHATAEPGPYSMERVLDPAGFSSELMSLNTQPALARLVSAAGAETWTEVLTPDLRFWAAGVVCFRNELGGRTAVLAATSAAELLPRDDGRRLLHGLIRFLEGDSASIPLVSGGPHLLPQWSQTGDTYRLAVVNGGEDPASLVVDLPGTTAEAQFVMLDPLQVPRLLEREPDGEGLVDTVLAHRSWLVIEWSKLLTS